MRDLSHLGVPSNDKLWKCPKCGVYALGSLWEECEPSCEDCGSHPGIRCPDCDEDIDLIMYDIEWK